MIKDFLSNVNGNVARYWTSHWLKNAKKNWDISKTEEYFLLNKYLTNKKDKILDVGCGLGYWVHSLNKKFPNIKGCELSFQLVKKANKLFKDKKIFQADIRFPTKINEKYDVIFSWGAFEHFEAGPGDCLLGCKKILKKKGVLIFTVPFQNLRMTIQKCIFFKSNRHKKSVFYQYRFTKGEICQELVNLDLVPLEIRQIHSVEGLKRFLHHNCKIRYDSFFNKSLSRILAPIAGKIFSHMIFVACRNK